MTVAGSVYAACYGHCRPLELPMADKQYADYMSKTIQTDLEDAIAKVASDLEPLREESVQARYLDEHGREKPNPTPMAPPIGYRRQPTIAEQMRQMIQLASLEAAQAGAETEEEANDFDVGEDMEPNTPYEHDFDPDPALEHMLALASRPPQAVAWSAPLASAAGTPSKEQHVPLVRPPFRAKRWRSRSRTQIRPGRLQAPRPPQKTVTSLIVTVLGDRTEDHGQIKKQPARRLQLSTNSVARFSAGI